MCNTVPIHQGSRRAQPARRWARAALCALALAAFSVNVEAAATRTLTAIDVHSLPGQRVELQLHLSDTAPTPRVFTIDNPPRIVMDLKDTKLGLATHTKNVNDGRLVSIATAEASDRTRVVLNLAAMVPYTTRTNGDILYVDLGGDASAASDSPFSGSEGATPSTASAAGRAIDKIDFRRGKTGAGQIIVDLTDPHTNVNIHKQNGKIFVDFAGTTLPSRLIKRLDVTDFATPVQDIDAVRADGHARLIVTPDGDYDQVAYQSDNVFTLELKRPASTNTVTGSGLFDSKKQYSGKRLTLNFQDISTRAVLQLLAETSGLNIVVSDSVQGNVTLRLENVPWDQALDILLTSKGLGMRRNGNVIFVAPANEIAAREEAQLKAAKALKGLSPLHTAFIQVNYAKASDLATLIKGSGASNSLLSERGSIAVDARTNTLLVQDTTERLQDIRRLIAKLDIPVRQVLIESRIVIVNDDVSRELGVRFGVTGVSQHGSNGLVSVTGNGQASNAIINSAVSNINSSGQPFPVVTPGIPQRYNVNLPAAPATGTAGSIALAILKSNTLLDLELSALQAEGKGRIVSTPHVVTANQHEAKISQGVEIPYQESASSGATTTQFKEAVLSLTVTPQITPDGRIIMDLHVTKDSVGQNVQSATGGSVPSIDTRSIETQVLVSNGQTVVLGGIYETEKRDTVTKVPLLGDIPVLGHLFKSRAKVTNKAQLLIFVTPKILDNGATSTAAAAL